MAYKIKVSPVRQADNKIVPVSVVKNGEVLTKTIMGQRASDLEERFFRAATKNKNISSVEYQPSFIAGRNVPGEIRLDFMVHAYGLMWPIQVDGEFAHGSAQQKEEDRQKDIILNNHLIPLGANPIQRVGEELLHDQDTADATVGRLFP
jgi:hypothetical protein